MTSNPSKEKNSRRADSSALIALALCDGLPLLQQLFEEVKVPQTVFEEVIIKGKPAAETLRIYLTGKAELVNLTDMVIAARGLGRGELEAMALYKTLHADYLLIDDKRARKVSRLNQIRITGSQGILLLAKHEGLIPLEYSLWKAVFMQLFSTFCQPGFPFSILIFPDIKQEISGNFIHPVKYREHPVFKKKISGSFQ